jgi:hypothetical protein
MPFLRNSCKNIKALPNTCDENKKAPLKRSANDTTKNVFSQPTGLKTKTYA